MPTLSALLGSRPAIRIRDLGSKSGQYLSFDRRRGWTIQRFDGCFGFVYRIFRSLGFYSSTHLKTIAEQMQKEEKLPDKLLQKMIYSLNPPPKFPHIYEPKRLVRPTDLPSAFEGSRLIGQTLFSFVDSEMAMNLKFSATIYPAPPSLFLVTGGGRLAYAMYWGEQNNYPPFPSEVLEQAPEIRPRVRCPAGGAIMISPPHSVKSATPSITRTIAVGVERPQDWLEGIEEALDLAKENGIRSVTLPLQAADKKAAIDQIRAVSQYLRKKENGSWFNEIVFYTDGFGQRAINAWNEACY